MAASCSKARCSAMRATPTAMIDGPSQFDFYSGGGLDIAFLGFGEIDATGNVNVSKLGGVTVGPGGFIDIAQNARKVVFCGTFDAKGTELEIGAGRLAHRAPRRGDQARRTRSSRSPSRAARRCKRGQQVVYVTERAVFRLTRKGLVLTEVAPGIDVRRDVLERMQFAPLVERDPALMAAAHFNAITETTRWRRCVLR